MVSSKGAPKNHTLAVLKAVMKTISALSLEDLQALATGAATLTLKRSSASSRQAEMELGEKNVRVFDYDQLQEELRAVESTEIAFAILMDAALSRAELERMARSLDLSVMKQDSVRRLEEKIVGALVGSRLNSRAVRGR